MVNKPFAIAMGVLLPVLVGIIIAIIVLIPMTILLGLETVTLFSQCASGGFPPS